MGTEILRYSSILSGLIPLLIFLKHKHSIKSNSICVLSLAILFSFLTDVVLAILYELKISNIIILNIYAICYFLAMMLFYIKLMPEKIEWLYPFVIVYFGFIFINTVLFQGINEYQGYSRAFGGLVLIVCTLMYFRSLLTTLPAVNILNYGLFWINVGIIYYYCFNLLLFIFSDYVFNNLTLDLRKVFWTFHNGNNIVKNSIFCVGFYFASKNQ